MNIKSKLLQYTKELVGLVVFITIFSNALSLYKSSSLNKLPLPSIIKMQKNKPILIHFWATWCPICKTEIDNIQRLSKQYQVVTIVVKSGTDNDIQQYLNKNQLDFKVINDADANLAQQFNINAYPTTIIYNKDREIVFSDVGYTSTLGLYLRMWWAS